MSLRKLYFPVSSILTLNFCLLNVLDVICLSNHHLLHLYSQKLLRASQGVACYAFLGLVLKVFERAAME